MKTFLSAHRMMLADVLLLIIALTLPFYQQASIFGIIALVLVWISQKQNFKNLSLLINHKEVIALIIFFMWHLIGLLWSENLHYGWQDIQTKLSFLVFPLVLGTLIVSKESFQKVKSAFVAGTIIACIYCTINALIRYAQTNDETVFFYKFYSVLMHVSYFSMYINLSMLFILEISIERWNQCSIVKKSEIVLALFFLLVNLIIITARTAIAAALITIMTYSIVKIIKIKKGLVILIGSLAVSSAISFYSTHLFNRYSQVEEAIEKYRENPPPSNNKPAQQEIYNSTTSRVEFWKNALTVIKQNWIIGVGTGDIKEELVAQYAKVGFQYGVENRFSPHDQYLHTTVILGVIGLAILLCCLLLPLRLAIQKRNWIFICFQLMIMLDAITESILERQNGIIFYAFFNLLFLNQILIRKNSEPATLNTGSAK